METQKVFNFYNVSTYQINPPGYNNEIVLPT